MRVSDSTVTANATVTIATGIEWLKASVLLRENRTLKRSTMLMKVEDRDSPTYSHGPLAYRERGRDRGGITLSENNNTDAHDAGP